jgi:hypothetical protein
MLAVTAHAQKARKLKMEAYFSDIKASVFAGEVRTVSLVSSTVQRILVLYQDWYLDIIVGDF